MSCIPYQLSFEYTNLLNDNFFDSHHTHNQMERDLVNFNFVSAIQKITKINCFFNPDNQ